MLRLKLLLGKFPVTEAERIHNGFRITININGFKLTCHNLPLSVDVHNGDLLTLYTEVATHAKPEQPPIQ